MSEARCAVIFMRKGESEEEAEDRHYREHPKDRAASRTITVSFVDPKAARQAGQRT
jgi:hypothetical protein